MALSVYCGARLLMTLGKILVTGGAGFIGSHVNHALHQAGYETVVFDNLSTGRRDAVIQGTFIQGDLSQPERLHGLFQKHRFLAVMHFAAHIQVGESFEKPLAYYRNNVSHTLQLLEVMETYGVEFFIFSSSAGIFGLPQDSLITEQHPCHPISPYGKSKLWVESMLHDIAESSSLKHTSLRYFNAAGGDPHGQIKHGKAQESNLIPILLKSIRSGACQGRIFGTDYPTKDGTCIRDYIHVTDLAQGHLLALEQLLQGGKSTAFNLGNGQGFSVREVMAACESVTGVSLNITEEPRRRGDPPRLVASAQKAHKELNWSPQYPQLLSIVQHAWEGLA